MTASFSGQDGERPTISRCRPLPPESLLFGMIVSMWLRRLFVVLGLAVLCAVGHVGEVMADGSDSPVYRPPDYVVIESNDSDICTPLLDSLNTLPPKDRPASVILPMVNRFLIEPWQPRGWRWNSYGVEKVYYWDAAFLDINKDGREDAIFRKATSLHARDYHKTYIVISPTPAALADPMPEEQVRLITEGDRALQTRVFLGGYLSYTELVSLRGEIFVMTGYRYDWWAEGKPGRWWVQLLRVAGDSFQRVCFFKAKQ